MSNTLYDSALTKFLSGGIDIDSDNIKVSLIRSAEYTYNASHDFFDDIPSSAQVATVVLASITVAAGVVDAPDITFPAVDGSACNALILWKDTGTPSTSPLIAYIDTGAGMPVTPDGTEIVVQWNASGIIKL